MSQPIGQRAPRYRVRGLTVVYDTGEEYWSGPVIDISASGLFIETTHELPLGTRITLLPDGPDDDRLPFEVTGVVVRVDELDLDEHWARTPGIAVRFEGLSQEQMYELHTCLHEYGTPVEPTP